MLHGGNQHTPLSGDGDNADLAVSSQRPDFLADDNQLLEKEHPAAGTTKNYFAWLNASEKSPRSYYDLNLAGIAGWRRLELDLGAIAPHPMGRGRAMVQARSPAPRTHAAAREGASGLGYSIRLINGEDLLRLIPNATPGEIGAANFADQEGTIDPIVAAKALVSAAKSLGATVIYPCEVKDFHPAERRVRAVITTQGSMEADYIVLATGNGTTELAAKAGMHVPLKESKGILAHTAPQPELLKRVMMPPGADVKQNFDGRIVTGANFGDTGDAQPTMELGHQFSPRPPGIFRN